MSGKWLAYSLACLVLWGFWGVSLKEAEQRLGEWYNVYVASNLAIVIAVAAVALIYRSSLTLEPRGFILALVAGALGTLGYVFLILALRAGGPAAIVIPLTALYPVITAIAAVALLGEELSTRQAVGIALAIAAIYLMTAG